MYTYDQIIHVLIAQWHSLSRDSAWIYSYIFIFLPLHHDTLNGDLAQETAKGVSRRVCGRPFNGPIAMAPCSNSISRNAPPRPCQTQRPVVELTSRFVDRSVYDRNTNSMAQQCQPLQVTAQLTTE